ncbi:MAG: hypothetical protein BJ554DRAFT_4657, partial [Olpidium bornovanus]
GNAAGIRPLLGLIQQNLDFDAFHRCRSRLIGALMIADGFLKGNLILREGFELRRGKTRRAARATGDAATSARRGSSMCRTS